MLSSPITLTLCPLPFSTSFSSTPILLSKQTFVWEYYDKDKAYRRIPESTSAGISPLDFYRQVVKPVFNMEDKLCLVNDPRPTNSYYKLYTVEYLGNLVEGGKTLYINLPVDKLKEFAAKVTTSKTKERCRILAELEQCVTDNGESSSGARLE